MDLALHSAFLIYVISAGYESEELLTIILHTPISFFYDIGISSLFEAFPWVLPFLLAILLYIVSCWTVRGLSMSMLRGKSMLAKMIIVSSVILPLVLIGFLGRHLFYSGYVNAVQSSSDKIWEVAKDTQNIFLCNFI